jgi:CheY-like chemotaxis protein
MATVLIVEDEANIRHFVAVNLKARGYAILEAASAEAGLQMVLDIKLPGMSGWSMLKMIDNDPSLPKIPTIVMTASSVISQPDEYAYSHLIKKLTKPISLNELLSAVEEIFG